MNNLESTKESTGTKSDCGKPVVSGSLSFKEQLLKYLIPRIEAMAEKEKTHLHYLIDNEAPTEFIQMSQKTHFHFLNKIKEYKEYAERL